MTEYEFTLKFSLRNAQADLQEYVELLGRSGCDDALIGIGQCGRIAFSFIRESMSAYEAVSSAIEDIRKVLPNARLIEAAPDLVGLTETADLLGFTRQNMRQLMIRAGATFPAPVRTGKPTIWHLSQLLVWMNKNRKYEIDEALIDVAKTNMEVNLAIVIQDLDPKSRQRVLPADSDTTGTALNTPNTQKKYAVIYLDLLGFKWFLNKDRKAAVEIHRDFHHILGIRGMSEGPLKRLAERHGRDSFEYFLPMSESVFILSEDPDKVAAQLSTLLSDIFLFSAHAYSMPDSCDVLQQRIREFCVNESGIAKVIYRKENWFPVLFSGGISYGEVEIVHAPSICDGREITFPNVIGPGIVQAVGLEQIRLPGPRILCDHEFVKQLGKPATNYLRKEEDVWELLWPGFKYFEGNDERIERYELRSLFSPALDLWKHFSRENSEKHYRAFLELIVRSHLAFSECASNPRVVNEFLEQKLNEAGLELCNSSLNSQLVFPD